MILTVLVGCYDRIEVDDMSYVIAVGIDKDRSETIELILQIVMPSKIEEGGGKDSIYTERIKTTDISTGINTTNNITGKIINLSHVKTIVFSKEIAQEGIQHYIKEIVNEEGFRPSINVVVAEETADEVLSSLISTANWNPSCAHKLNGHTYLHSELIKSTTLHEFYLGLGKEHTNVVTALADKEKVIGIAIFNKGIMAGHLNEKESLYYSLMNSETNEYIIPMLNVIDEGNQLTIKLSKSAKPTYSLIDFKKSIDKNNVIKIRINLKVDAQILSNNNTYFSMNTANSNLIKEKIEQQITKGIIEYLEYTKLLKADINGFGEIIKRRFLTLSEWEIYNWPKPYKDIEFNVNTTVNLKNY
jgi:spore germination protein KC